MFTALSLFFKSNLKSILLGVGLGITVLTAYIYYTWSQKEIATLRANTATLREAVINQQFAISSLKKSFEKAKELNKSLAEKNIQYNEELAALRHKFTKNGRDFGKLAKEKPELVERIINNATKQSLRCLEEITKENGDLSLCE